MIPVDETLCSYIDFSTVSDIKYRSLLQKEYSYLIPYKNQILGKAKILYFKQKETGNVKDYYCSFSLLEEAYKKYIGSNNESEEKQEQ